MSDAVKLNGEEENLELLEGFTLLDDEFMTIVFDRNTEATELLLNIILGRNDMEVTEVVAQREYKNPGADVRRARFHSSMLDTKMLKEKQKFKELHESYVIFITKNDYMKMGLPLYHVERTVQESGALFGDGAHIIYVNGSYKNDSDPVGKLMHDFRCTSAVDMFYQELAKSVRHFKETEGGRSQMSKAMEERINREKDKERIETLFGVVEDLMEAMKMTAEQAMSLIKISDEDKVVLSKRFSDGKEIGAK